MTIVPEDVQAILRKSLALQAAMSFGVPDESHEKCVQLIAKDIIAGLKLGNPPGNPIVHRLAPPSSPNMYVCGWKPNQNTVGTTDNGDVTCIGCRQGVGRNDG